MIVLTGVVIIAILKKITMHITDVWINVKVFALDRANNNTLKINFLVKSDHYGYLIGDNLRYGN